MKFGPVPLDEALGKILGHNIAGSDGRRRLRKGKPLGVDDIEELRALGRRSVFVAELEPFDLDENIAATTVAEACLGPGLRISGASTGRVNLVSTVHGLTRVRDEALRRLHDQEGITVATVAAHQVVRVGQTVATVKIIPYALPETVVAAATAAASPGILSVVELPARRVGLILSGSRSVSETLAEGFAPLAERVSALGSRMTHTEFVDLDEGEEEGLLVAALQRMLAADVDLGLLAGETAIMDRHDMTPRAVERVGGRVETVGAPVDPGNLLMLAYVGEVPIVGAPGCARSRKVNVVDWVLPRLLAGERLARSDIVAFGHGGLLEDVPERPVPRSRVV